MANISKIKLPNNSSLDVKALAIPIGTVDSTSTSTVFTFTVPGITSLYDGVIFAIRNTVVASASGWTANVNGLGAKQVYGSNNTRVTTGFAKNYWYIFVYDETNDRWTQAMLTDANSTYTNVTLGQGYGTCTTAAETTAKVVTLASYALTTGGIVAVKFDNDVPTNATMNINSKGAKAIYHRGAAITAGVIKGGDTAYFIYSTYYHLLGVDRIISKVSDLTNDVGYTTNIGTVTGDNLTANNIILGNGSSAIKSSGKTIATTLGTDDTTVPTSKAVKDVIDALPEPMIFKGTLGTGGTITSLPAAAAGNTGYTYKVITDGTYQSIAAKAGDTFISNGSSWTLIPSGDEPSGTVTSVTLKATSPIAIDSTAAITTSGTRTISHADSGVTAGTYKSVTVDAKGHVTGGTNPTTLNDYGITDAINTSSTAQTKAGNLTAAKFITSGGTSSQFVKGDGSLDIHNYMKFKFLNPNGTYLASSGRYLKLTMPSPTQAWMMTLGVVIYSGYVSDIYYIGGYNYRSGTKTWYSPSVVYLSSGAYTKTIYFGKNDYDGGDNKLWVALPMSSYSHASLMQNSARDYDFDIQDIEYSLLDANPENWDASTNGNIVFTRTVVGTGSYLPRSGGTLTGNITAPSFIKSGGTSSQFLKADGSVDSNTYITSASLPSAMSASEANTGTATTARTITAAVLAGAIDNKITTMTQAEVTNTINTIFS